MEVTTYNQKGQQVGKIDLPKEIFEVKMNPDLVYQVAVTQMGNQRQGNAHTKGRGEVSGGGKKPWRQKGTGRARQGSIRSPQWRHGGVVFGPRKDKVYGGKINKKMRRKALAMVLSAKVADKLLIIIDSLEISQPKTKQMVEIVGAVKKACDLGKGKMLVALPEYEKNAVLAGRNIPDFATIEAAKLNVLELLNTKYLLMPAASVKRISAVGSESEIEAANDRPAQKTVAPVEKAQKTAKTRIKK